MTAYINKIKSKAGDQQLPVTHERAVRDDNGTTLESKLQNLEGAMDKAYVASSDNGMGRITLKKNMVSGVNTLTQSMMQATNTIYVIQYDFTLGENITVPANCVLEFDGGSINNPNGKAINGQNTSITGNPKILTIWRLGGTWNIECFYANWFGAKGDGTTNDSAAIQMALWCCQDTGVSEVRLLPGNYNIVTPIILGVANMGINGSYDIKGVTLRGTRQKEGSRDSNRSATLIGNTGNYAIIESIDGSEIKIEDLNIISGSNTPSTVGIALGRGTRGRTVAHAKLKNLLIDLNNDATVNNTVGTIGLYMVSAEESSVCDCDIKANCPICCTSTNGGINFYKYNGTSLENYVNYKYTNYSLQLDNEQQFIEYNESTSVIHFNGGRYVAKGVCSPCVKIYGDHAHGCIQVSFTHMYFRREDYTIEAINTGVGYVFESENWKCSEVKDVLCEHCRGFIVAKDDFIGNNFKVVYSAPALGANNISVVNLYPVSPDLQYKSMVYDNDLNIIGPSDNTLPYISLISRFSAHLTNIDIFNCNFYGLYSNFVNNIVAKQIKKNVTYNGTLFADSLERRELFITKVLQSTLLTQKWEEIFELNTNYITGKGRSYLLNLDLNLYYGSDVYNGTTSVNDNCAIFTKVYLSISHRNAAFVDGSYIREQVLSMVRSQTSNGYDISSIDIHIEVSSGILKVYIKPIKSANDPSGLGAPLICTCKVSCENNPTNSHPYLYEATDVKDASAYASSINVLEPLPTS